MVFFVKLIFEEIRKLSYICCLLFYYSNLIQISDIGIMIPVFFMNAMLPTGNLGTDDAGIRWW